MIYNVSAGMLECYINYNSKTKLTPKEMFQRLSVSMGGDGSKITKDMLNNYLKDAEYGKVKLSDNAKSALKFIQDEWDTIAGDDDELTLDDMKDFTHLLAIISAGGATKLDELETEVETEDKSFISSELTSDFLSDLTANSDKKGISKFDLKNYLNSLISENLSINNEEIAILTNIIADYDQWSSIEVNA